MDIDEAVDEAVALYPPRSKPKPQAPKQERTGKLYVSLPQDLFDRLDEVLLMERKIRRPDKVDKSVLVEEALQAWLKKHKY